MRIKVIINITGLLIVMFLFPNTSTTANTVDQSFEYNIQKAIEFKYINYDSVVHFAKKAIDNAKNDVNPSEEIDALLLLSKTYIKAGKLVDALNTCNIAKNISDANQYLNRDIDPLIYIGNIYQALGFSAEALEYFFQAKNKLNDNVINNNKAKLHYYISVVYYNLGDIERCRKNLRLSLNASLISKFYSISFSSYLLYSSTFESIDSVHKYMYEADQIISNNPTLIYEKVGLRNNQALLNEELGNYKKSKSQYIEAIHSSIDNGFRGFLANIYNNYSYFLISENKYDSANIVLKSALSIAKELNNSDLTASIYDSYSDYYSEIDEYKTSLVYKDSSINKRNEFHNQQRIQKSLFLSAVFEKEQQDKEIILKEIENIRLWTSLFSIIAILALAIGLVVFFVQKFTLSKARVEALEKSKSLEIADALIEGQDSERKRLAMDLHDGLGARLGSLRFMIDGYFRKHENYEDVKRSIIEVTQNVRDISHRMLPAQLEEIGLISTIRSMVNSINKSDTFSVKFDTNINSRLSKKVEVNIYYLIHELVNNATKHSSGNEIVIQLFNHTNALQLSVEDNGGSFKTDSSNFGLGLKNIKTRVKYLNGTLNIEADETETLFLIEIPI